VAFAAGFEGFGEVVAASPGRAFFVQALAEGFCFFLARRHGELSERLMFRSVGSYIVYSRLGLGIIRPWF